MWHNTDRETFLVSEVSNVEINSCGVPDLAVKMQVWFDTKLVG